MHICAPRFRQFLQHYLSNSIHLFLLHGCGQILNRNNLKEELIFPDSEFQVLQLGGRAPAQWHGVLQTDPVPVTSAEARKWVFKLSCILKNLAIWRARANLPSKFFSHYRFYREPEQRNPIKSSGLSFWPRDPYLCDCLPTSSLPLQYRGTDYRPKATESCPLLVCFVWGVCG